MPTHKHTRRYGQTDITNLIVPFCNFTNAPNNVESIGDFNTELTIGVM